MSYVIYHTETTHYMPSMKRDGYASKGAATRALNLTHKLTEFDLEIADYFDIAYKENDRDYRKAVAATMKAFNITSHKVKTNSHIAERDLVNKDDYSIAEAGDFHENIEKMVTRINLMSKKEYKERANTPISCSPAFETYWSM